MQLTLSSLFLSLLAFSTATTVPAKRSECAEASRFGVLQVVPSTLSPGDWFTIHADFDCAVNYFGIVPKYVDYYIEVTANNNGHEPPIVLARRDYNSDGAPADTFTVQMPHAYYFNGSTYSVVLDNTYPINGTDNSTVYVVGGIESPINVTNISN